MTIEPATQNGSKVTYELEYLDSFDTPGWVITSVNGQKSLFVDCEDTTGVAFIDIYDIREIVHDLVQHHHHPVDIYSDEVTAVVLGCQSFNHISGNFASDCSDTLAHGLATGNIQQNIIDLDLNIDHIGEYAIEYIDGCWMQLKSEVIESLNTEYIDHNLDPLNVKWDKIKHWLYICTDKAEELIAKYGTVSFDDLRIKLTNMLPYVLSEVYPGDVITITIDFNDYTDTKIAIDAPLI